MEAVVPINRGCHVWIFAVLLFTGCGSDVDRSKDDLESMVGGALKAVFPVSGKVLLDGEAKEGVNLYLFKPDGTPMTNNARTKADGTYCWSTYEVCDGVEAGDYVVCFRYIPKQKSNDRGDSDEVDLLEGKFSDPKTSEFKLTVSGAPQENINYELKTK